VLPLLGRLLTRIGWTTVPPYTRDEPLARAGVGLTKPQRAMRGFRRQRAEGQRLRMLAGIALGLLPGVAEFPILRVLVDEFVRGYDAFVALNGTPGPPIVGGEDRAVRFPVDDVVAARLRAGSEGALAAVCDRYGVALTDIVRIEQQLRVVGCRQAICIDSAVDRMFVYDHLSAVERRQVLSVRVEHELDSLNKRLRRK